MSLAVALSTSRMNRRVAINCKNWMAVLGWAFGARVSGCSSGGFGCFGLSRDLVGLGVETGSRYWGIPTLE